ncbi:MAG: hypothetical protein EXR63_02995 [Dehalococcoidia bacterium]|nr:hypothetical protein [Dehalococcoidia bacterium]
MLLDLTALLYRLGVPDFERVLILRGRSRPYFSVNASDLHDPGEVRGSGLHAETNMSSERARNIAYRVIRILGFPDSDLEIDWQPS